MMTLRAFHNDPEIKKEYLTRVRLHRAADQIRQNYYYWEDGKGSAVGCTVHSGDHFAYERELGIPVIVALLQDRIFEGLPLDQAKAFPELFLSAISPGADLSKVWAQFVVWLLVDPLDGVIRLTKTDGSRKGIQHVATLYREGCIAVLEWDNAQEAALETVFAVLAVRSTPIRWWRGAAAEEAAWAAAKAAKAAALGAQWEAAPRKELQCALWAAADAADAAGETARWAAEAAMEGAESEEAAVKAKEAAYVKQSEKLLELLRAA